MKTVWDDQINVGTLLWRYFKTPRFVSLVQTARLYFSPVAHFDDRFEGAVAVIPPKLVDPRYTESEFIDKAFEAQKDDINVSCWHEAEHESDAMWRLYAGDSKGVVLCSTLERMASAILPFHFTPTSQPEDIWAGPVRYVDLTRTRLRPNGMQRFFYKHVAFEFEKEFRLAFNLENAYLWNGRSGPEGVFVSVDLNLLIERIILGPQLSENERAEISEHVHAAGLEGRLVDSIMLGQPRYL